MKVFVKLFTLSILLSFALPLHAEWVAEVTWRLGNINANQTFKGAGFSKEDAYADAQLMCLNLVGAEAWKSFCYNQPVNENYDEKDYCGDYWTDWVRVGSLISNPCPTSCGPGKELARNQRVTDSYFAELRYKFQCWR